LLFLIADYFSAGRTVSSLHFRFNAGANFRKRRPL